MKLDPIVVSLLDTDLYKFNMNQVIFHKHTSLVGEYHFKCRNAGVVFTPEMLEEINAQIDHLCSLTFKKEELDYLRAIRFIISVFRTSPRQEIKQTGRWIPCSRSVASASVSCSRVWYFRNVGRIGSSSCSEILPSCLPFRSTTSTFRCEYRCFSASVVQLVASGLSRLTSLG